MGEWSALITAIGGLVSAVVWPVVLVAVVVMFRSQIGALLKSDDISLSGPGGLTLAAKRKTTEAANALVQASKARAGTPISSEQASADVIETQRHLESISDPVILWVDDDPSATSYERSAMEALGISFDLSVDTDTALQKLELSTYDAVISDMGRPPDARAGYTLLDEMRRSGNTTPVVFYTTSRAQEHFNEAVEHGALGCTNRADELMQMVVTALRVSGRRSEARTDHDRREGAQLYLER